MRTRTVSLLLCSALLVLAGCAGGLPSSPEAAPSPIPARSHSGYFIQMPSKATTPRVEAPPGAVLTVTSNLPAETLAYVTSDIRGAGEEIMLLHRFVQGFLTVRKGFYCDGSDAELARGFNVQIIVVPDISLIYKGDKAVCRSLTDCGAGPFQPRSVQSVLGRNFERLVGEDVTTILRTRALVASAHYDWPSGVCRKPLEVAVGLPSVCPASTRSINEDERGENVDLVVDSMRILLGANRVCDLYNFTTEDFRKDTSWPTFRERMRRWLQTKGRTPADRTFGFRVDKGRADVGVAKSPRFLAVLYTNNGKLVMRARFEATATRPGYTRWEIAKLELV